MIEDVNAAAPSSPRQLANQPGTVAEISCGRYSLFGEVCSNRRTGPNRLAAGAAPFYYHYHCPLGRPYILSFLLYDGHLNKKFGQTSTRLLQK